MKTILFFCLTMLQGSLLTECFGATNSAASTSAADVQAAINAAASGDTVVVPAGSSTWSGNSVVVSGKSLTIMGNGIGSTVITDGTSGGAMGITANAPYFVRVSGLTFQSSGTHTSDGMIEFYGSQTNLAFRLDHCRMVISSAVTRGVLSVGAYGLIDDCNFDITATSGSIQSISIWGSDDGSDGGFTPWTRPLTLGTTNAVYIETCNFNYTTAIAGQEDCIDGYGGARVVVRQNNFTNVTQGFHGTDSGDRRSLHSFEIYSNTYVNNSSQTLRAATIRGGTGVFYGNNYGGSHSTWDGVTLMYYRACPPLDQSSWGTCDGTLWKLNSATLSANGSRQCATSGTVGFANAGNEILGTFGVGFTNYFDGPSPIGYPGRDQPGITTGQITTPIAVWDNAQPASIYDGGDPPAGGLQQWIAEGRDYTNNSWSAGYTSLIYPHPLITGTVGPDPSISSQPSNQSVNVGSTATWNVTAAGTGIHYQWRRNGSNVGSDQNSYALANCQNSNNGDVVAVKIAGNLGQSISQFASLTVTGGSTPAPASSLSTASGVTVSGGGTILTR